MRYSLLFLLILPIIVFAQPAQNIPRPKLVVGIVVDQMRWDYLYRYYDRYETGGFKRLLNQGFSCENTFINYLPSKTAVGHTSIFTGSVPAIHGIAGNDWVEQYSGQHMYCTDDSTVKPVGTIASSDGKMSPRNLLVSTITDELKLATNFRSKVIGVSLKDRASILPAGHLGEAFWLDDASACFISSTYYHDILPQWVVNFNKRKEVEKLLDAGWQTLYPINSYVQSDPDDERWEGVLDGKPTATFPYDLKKAYAANKSSFRSTPFGNTLTADFAKAAIRANAMGKDSITDFLTINFASTDYIGHMVGVNAVETEDCYLRLDRELAGLFQFLDANVGKGQYTVFLTADHGAAHNIAFMQQHHLPADGWVEKPLLDTLNSLLERKFGVAALVRSFTNEQVNFNLTKTATLDFSAVKATTIDFLQRQPGISFAVDAANIGAASVPEPLKTMITNGHNVKRSGQVEIVFDPGWFESATKKGTTHGSWNPYDTHIPLLWYGWGVKPGHSNNRVYITDISATLAAMLHIQMPNGCIGKVIEDVME